MLGNDGNGVLTFENNDLLAPAHFIYSLLSFFIHISCSMFKRPSYMHYDQLLLGELGRPVLMHTALDCFLLLPFVLQQAKILFIDSL